LIDDQIVPVLRQLPVIATGVMCQFDEYGGHRTVLLVIGEER
jgi:hypothetical protein